MNKSRLGRFLAYSSISIAVIVLIIATAVNIHARNLTTNTPVVADKLDALEARIEASISTSTPETDPVSSKPTEDASIPDAPQKSDSETHLPTSLNRILTADEIVALHAPNYANADALDKMAKRAELALGKTLYSFATIFNFDEDSIPLLGSAIGRDLMQLGKLESARGYLWAGYESLELTDPDYSRRILGELAWLETDPETAARMLELSCIDQSLWALSNARQLCVATGSHELAEHYFRLLRIDNPTYTVTTVTYERTVSP